jgi:hypothetical protein
VAVALLLMERRRDQFSEGGSVRKIVLPFVLLLGLAGPAASTASADVPTGCPRAYTLATIDQATDTLFEVAVPGVTKEEIREGITTFADLDDNGIVCYTIGRNVHPRFGGVRFFVVDNLPGVSNP